MQITSIVKTVASGLRSGDKVRFEIERSGDTINLIFQPILSDDEDKTPEDAKAVRAALAMPFIMRGVDSDTAEAQIIEHLTQFNSKRQIVRTAFDELMEKLEEAAKRAKASAEKTTANGKGKTKAVPVVITHAEGEDSDDDNGEGACCGASCGETKETSAASVQPVPAQVASASSLFDF